MAYKAPDIGTLSAHDYNKIRTSFDAFKKTQGKYEGDSSIYRHERSFFEKAKGEAASARQPFKKGGTYGIEDEYRYMVSQGFNPASMAIGSGQVSEEAKETVQEAAQPGATANDKDGDGYLDVGGIPKTGSGAIDFRMFVGKDEASRKAAFEQHGEQHFGINALRRAQQATGLGIKEIEKQAWDQGLRFGEHAAVERDTGNYADTGVQDLKDQITTLTTNFDTKLKEYQDIITNMQRDQKAELGRIQSQMNQAVVQASNRPTTLGVRAAGGSPILSAARGATGFFGRSGMRIKSMNV
tara:strand:+ start:3281 stop:4171 length:891 start_codon:yes stop_codon:yes gene_type:complete